MNNLRSRIGLRKAEPVNTSRLTQRAIFRALSSALATAWLATGIAEPAFGAVSHPKAPESPQTWPVQTCQDTTLPGSLRYIAVQAQPGDTIDFSQLPMACGMADSTITLTSGEIVLHQANITLLGPAPGTGTVTISAGGASRVLRHQMYSPFDGTLQIFDLRLTDGYAHASGDIGGGCIHSNASIALTRSVVSDCVARTETGNANGGAINAYQQVSLLSSIVTGSTVHVGSNGNAIGGGVSALILFSKYSEITNNRAEGGSLGSGEGGGAAAHSATIAYSTIADNYSDAWGGGLFVGDANLNSTIVDSTFSGNHSLDMGGAIRALVPALYLRNTTVALNTTDASHGAGVYFNGTTAEIESTIIGKNTAAVPTNGADLYVKSGALTGAANLVMSSSTNPPGVIASSSDPGLSATLAWIGGPTRALGLLPNSPAIAIGNNGSNRQFDQRGAGYPRATGPVPSVDVGAVQFDDRIFVSDLDHFFF